VASYKRLSSTTRAARRAKFARLAEIKADRAAGNVQRGVRKFLESYSKEERSRLDQISDQGWDAKLADRAVKEQVAITRAELLGSIQRYQRGRIDVAGLRDEMRQSLRVQTLAVAIIGVGGPSNLTGNVIEAVRRRLTDQFNLLDGFVYDIMRAPDARHGSRADLYANAAHSVSQVAQRQFMLDTLGEDSVLEERRVLGESDHCDDCVALASMGFVEVGVLPQIGQGTECGNHCRCTIETRVGQGGDRTNQTDSERPQGA
jgi:hypothetical protein